MADRLAGPRAKVERAKDHVHDLEVEARAFFDSNPYVIGTKRNPETRQLIYYLVNIQQPPLALAAIAGDALQNLRSALDHLAYQLVLVGTNQPGPLPYVYFPVFNSAAEYKAKRLRQVQGMRKEAIDAIDAAKPYKGGNNSLWMLHRLNTVDKHRLLVAVGSTARSVDLGGFAVRQLVKLAGRELPQLSAFFKAADRLCPLKEGDELFTDLPDAEVDEKLQFAFDVAFSEPKISECEPILETLHQMTDLVDNLLASFRPLL